MHFFDSWTSAAVESNDTSFSYRSVSFALDSSIVLNWGTEEQAQLRTFNDNGIISTEYEWRKYGLEITIKGPKFTGSPLDYVFREKDANTTILSGSVVGSPGDTLVISGDYQQMRDINRGVPGLSRIPFFFVCSFSEVDKVAENRKFYIYLIPNGGKNENLVFWFFSCDLGKCRNHERTRICPGREYSGPYNNCMGGRLDSGHDSEFRACVPEVFSRIAKGLKTNIDTFGCMARKKAPKHHPKGQQRQQQVEEWRNTHVRPSPVPASGSNAKKRQGSISKGVARRGFP